MPRGLERDQVLQIMILKHHTMSLLLLEMWKKSKPYVYCSMGYVEIISVQDRLRISQHAFWSVANIWNLWLGCIVSKVQISDIKLHYGIHANDLLLFVTVSSSHLKSGFVCAGFFPKFLMGGLNFRSPSVPSGDKVGWGGGTLKKIRLKPKMPS